MSICLTMIVKDEAHIVKHTLQHLTEHFTFAYWVIDDTGSTDGTPTLIQEFFAEKGISGELHETPWRNFGYNRTEAFNHAYNKTDYVLVWDADDSIVGDFNLPSPLTGDQYTFIFGNSTGFRYSRTQLFNNRKRWKYVGVLHEYPACCEAASPSMYVDGNYYFVSGRSGARSKDPHKYLRDAEVLERGLEEEPNNDRYAFYCANSYKDAGRPDKAIQFYKKVLTMSGWAEEKYLAALNIYDLSSCEENLFYLVEANRHSPNRAEAVLRLIKHYCVKGMHRAALAYYTLVQEYMETRYLSDDTVPRKLFVSQIDYDFYLPYYVIISALHERKYEIAINAFFTIFSKKPVHIGEWWINNIFHNIGMLIDVMPMPDLDFLFHMLEYRDMMGFSLGDLQNKHIAAIIDKHRPLLTATPSQPLPSPAPTESPRVMLTITTCKRIDLFEKTVNSMLATWKDIDSVDYFLCVDDNSNIHDRARMRELYPFFNFYMKTPAEKGHRQSMNIIWDHLNRMRPTYWIHLEDDFLFFRSENYVRRSIDALTRHNGAGVHQILFNRNYTELYDWTVNGGKVLEKGTLLHVQSDTIAGRNCGYWPHYSFRPSMIRTETILSLGNYNTPNTFFEMDYAKRWVAAGYKSAFYDTITCLHIGKLTSDKSGQNAYSLNNVSQFGGSVTDALSSDYRTLVVNLVRRPDRKEQMQVAFRECGVSEEEIEFFEAVDGKELTNTSEIITLFAGNDFGSRRGFFGCALSHYRIWQRLATDASCGYYIIYEDDIRFCENYAARIREAQEYFVDNNIDIMMLGYTQTDQLARFRHTASRFAPLDRSKYLGGTFGYIISKRGAKAYLDFISENGIRHGIDYLLKLLPENLRMVSVHPHIVYSEWAQSPSSNVDSDIQYSGDSVNLLDGWDFYVGLDHIGDDIRFVGKKSPELILREAIRHPDGVGFNTLGFIKSRVDVESLVSSQWFGNSDGIFIRRKNVEEAQ